MKLVIVMCYKTEQKTQWVKADSEKQEEQHVVGMGGKYCTAWPWGSMYSIVRREVL